MIFDMSMQSRSIALVSAHLHVIIVLLRGQHDGQLPFWLLAINPLFISLPLHVLLAVGEIVGR